MSHDFEKATVELYGIRHTLWKTAAFNDKKLDVMVDVFARSIFAGKNLGFSQARDSVITSEVSWAMHASARDPLIAIRKNSPQTDVWQASP
jgi:hypothetical protein